MLTETSNSVIKRGKGIQAHVNDQERIAQTHSAGKWHGLKRPNKLVGTLIFLIHPTILGQTFLQWRNDCQLHP